MTALTAREAYRLWAPDYERETAISALEAVTVDALGIETAGRALLDAGCGTGRRLRSSGAECAVGIDLSLDMLRRVPDEPRQLVAAGDLCAIPVPSNAFDVVWCRLAIGHVRDLSTAYAELARVCRTGGSVIVSDLSPDAAAAGHRRTFHDAEGTTREVEHIAHSFSAHVVAATRAGLMLTARRDGCCGPVIRQFYADAGRLDAYEEQVGTPIVIVLALRKVIV